MKELILLSDEELIELRKATQATNTKPWADTLSFGHAIQNKIKEINELLLAQPLEPRL